MGEVLSQEVESVEWSNNTAKLSPQMSMARITQVRKRARNRQRGAVSNGIRTDSRHDFDVENKSQLALWTVWF
jgi:hypothetical protein